MGLKTVSWVIERIQLEWHTSDQFGGYLSFKTTDFHKNGLENLFGNGFAFDAASRQNIRWGNFWALILAPCEVAEPSI
jgi:hypothetical protein